MNFNQLGIFSYLFFLLNAVKFNMSEGEGGGASSEDYEKKNHEESKKWADPKVDSDAQGQDSKDSGGQEGGDAGKIEDLPEWAQKHIKELRGESAANRTKFKDLEGKFGNLEKGLKSALGMEEGEEISPEEHIQNLTNQGQELAMQNAVLNVALENGLSRDQAEYFQFLLQKEGESMEDDQELTEERYEELVAKAKGLGGSGSPANTSVDGGGSNPPADNGSSDVIDVEKFSKMNYTEKVNLRAKSPELYNKLFAEARSKGMF